MDRLPERAIQVARTAVHLATGVKLSDPLDVVAGLAKVRDACASSNSSGTGVVRRQSQANIAAVILHQLLELAHSRVNILLWIKRVVHVQRSRCFWHELHKAHGTFTRHGIGIEIRFDFDDGPYQVGIYIMPGSRLLNGGVHILLAEVAAFSL